MEKELAVATSSREEGPRGGGVNRLPLSACCSFCQNSPEEPGAMTPGYGVCECVCVSVCVCVGRKLRTAMTSGQE